MKALVNHVVHISSFYNSKTKSRLSAYIFLVLWTLPLLIGGLDQQSIKPHDEGLYATRARLMWSTGDWVNPWSNPHHKPPGIYCLLGILYQFWGINETTIRLPSIIFSLISVILLYEIGSLIFNSCVGLLGAAILNLQFLWLQYSRLANPDLATIFLVLWAIFLLLKSESKLFKYHDFSLALAGGCLGLAILFRGLMMVIPFMALIPYLILEHRRHQHLKQSWLYLGFALGIIPLLLWLYLSWLRFGNKTLNRLLGIVITFGGYNRHDHNILSYLTSLASSAFPWGLVAIVGLFFLWWNNVRSYWSLTVRFPSICLILISIYSTRLHHYALIIYPFTALLSGFVLSACLPTQRRHNLVPQWFFSTLSYILGSIGLILLIAATVVFCCVPSKLQYAQMAIATSVPWIGLCLIYHRRDSLYI
ncbi:MAG: glycosyltransferase family 39 protein [Cyanobacteria bacterium P01_G01_bin.67]